MRPRCRDWIPLATQQLRLRNLVRIHGYNIKYFDSDCPNEEALIYYTLHSNQNELPFYQSESLPQRHFQQKWAEITCPELLKSNANCVCVKVWAQFKSTDCGIQNHSISSIQEPQVSISALTDLLEDASLSPENLPRPPDVLLFCWGVYFSGLVLFEQQSDAKFSDNTLIFQLNGDYFTSSTQLTSNTLLMTYQRYLERVPKLHNSTEDQFLINSPGVSRSSSPIDFDKQQRDLESMSKVRYLQLNYERKSDSYSLEKLLKLQERQRLTQQTIRDTREISEDIKQLCTRCITKDQITHKPRTNSGSYHHHHQHQYHSIGRKLSVLLDETKQVSPHVLLKAQHLQTQLETLGWRHRFLNREYNIYSKRIENLRQTLKSLTESRNSMEAVLREHQQHFQKERISKDEKIAKNVHLSEKKEITIETVQKRMSLLCIELREIYPIRELQNGLVSICGITFPDIYAFIVNVNYADGLQNVSPMGLSACLGYIAHLTQMIAVILDQPLRNPILHEGSRSRIIDAVSNLPPMSREFPLYTRSMILTKLVTYAIQLLSQNIAQLCFNITHIRHNVNEPIKNLLLIFERLTEGHDSKFYSMHSKNYSNNHLNSNRNGHLEKGLIHDTDILDGVDLSHSHSSIDVSHHVPVPISLMLSQTTSTIVTAKSPSEMLSMHQQRPSSQPIAIAARNSIDGYTRISRSAGSYSDCNDYCTDGYLSNDNFCSSESNIAVHRNYKD